MNTLRLRIAARFPNPRRHDRQAHARARLSRGALAHALSRRRRPGHCRRCATKPRRTGYFPAQTGLLLNNWGDPVDLTNPRRLRVVAGPDPPLHRPWASRASSSTTARTSCPGLLGVRNVWQFADGSDERTMHEPLPAASTTASTRRRLPRDGGFLLCRHATYGDQQRWRQRHLAGRPRRELRPARRPMVGEDEDAYIAVGGLPASVVGGLSPRPVGLSVLRLGHRRLPPLAAGQGDVHALVRADGALERDADRHRARTTSPGSSHPRPASTRRCSAGTARYTRLHLRLFPYEWTYAQNASPTDGRPIQRPLGLAYPELGVHPADTYLFGDDLLVAPVVERGARTAQRRLAPGTLGRLLDGRGARGRHDHGRRAARQACRSS